MPNFQRRQISTKRILGYTAFAAMLCVAFSEPVFNSLHATGVVAANYHRVRTLDVRQTWHDETFAAFEDQAGNALVVYRSDAEATAWAQAPEFLAAVRAAVTYAWTHRQGGWMVTPGESPAVPLRHVIDLATYACDPRPLMVLAGHGGRERLRIEPQFYRGDKRYLYSHTPAAILGRLPSHLLSGRHVVVAACNPDSDTTVSASICDALPVSGAQHWASGSNAAGEALDDPSWVVVHKMRTTDNGP